MGPEAGAAPPTLWPEQLSAFLNLLFNLHRPPTPVAPLQGAAFRRCGSRWGGQVGASISSLAASPLGFESALEKAGLRGRWRGMRCALDSLPGRTPEPGKLGLQALAADSPGRGGRGGSGERGGRRGSGQRDLSVWYLRVGGERAASRFPAITRHICYCRFINEACGNEDWLVHRANWTGGRKKSQKRESHVQVWVQLSLLLVTGKDLPLPLPPPNNCLGLGEWGRGGEGMEGCGGGAANSLHLPALHPFSFLMNTGHNFGSQ